MSAYLLATECMLRSKSSFQGSVLSFYPVGSRDQMQVVRWGSISLAPVSDISSCPASILALDP